MVNQTWIEWNEWVGKNKLNTQAQEKGKEKQKKRVFFLLCCTKVAGYQCVICEISSPYCLERVAIFSALCFSSPIFFFVVVVVVTIIAIIVLCLEKYLCIGCCCWWCVYFVCLIPYSGMSAAIPNLMLWLWFALSLSFAPCTCVLWVENAVSVTVVMVLAGRTTKFAWLIKCRTEYRFSGGKYTEKLYSKQTPFAATAEKVHKVDICTSDITGTHSVAHIVRTISLMCTEKGICRDKN